MEYKPFEFSVSAGVVAYPVYLWPMDGWRRQRAGIAASTRGWRQTQVSHGFVKRRRSFLTFLRSRGFIIYCNIK